MRISKSNYINDIDYQKQIIDSFPEPQSDYDRVDFNYLVLRKVKGISVKRLIFEVASVFAIPILLVLYTINRLCYRNKKQNIGKTIIIESYNRKGKAYDFEGRVPEFGIDYNPVFIYKTGAFPKITGGVIGRTALKIYLKFVCRHPFWFFYNLRCLVNLMGYNKLLYLHSPKAIVNSRMEVNPMSSIISCLCESCGCEFICFMHGEVMIDINTAFVRFSHFYIWDHYYIDVFKWSRCDMGHYVIYKPELYMLPDSSVTLPRYYLTYYLTGNEKNGVDLKANEICKILVDISKSGKRCKVRPHPRWSSLDQLKLIFDKTNIEIEQCKILPVKDSILDSEVVIGTFSSVLTEAYYLGKKVYIDDVSDPALIKELVMKKYFLLSKEVGFLSELLNDQIKVRPQI